MDFSFTQEQQMLRDGFGKYLEKSYDFDARQAVIRSEQPWSEEAWAQYKEFGLFALPFAEDRGGLGGSISDCVAIAELMGQFLTIEPYFASVILAGGALARCDSHQAKHLLERVISGEAIAAFAYEEASGTANADMITMTAEAVDGGFTLSGEKTLVLAGAEATFIVAVARMSTSGHLGLFLVSQGAEGLESREYPTIDGVRAANLRFDKVMITHDAALLDDAADVIRAVLHRAMIVQCAEAVGAMGALLSMTSEYAATRKQFGVPIASFQAVAHRLADMKIAYNKARATLIYTTALSESGAAHPRDIAIMKGQIGKLGRAVGEAAIQTHGGVGMTDELSVSHYHKRLLALDARFGNHAYHLRTLGQR